MNWVKIDHQKYELHTPCKKIMFIIRRHGGDWLLQRKMMDTRHWIDVLRSRYLAECKVRAIELIEDWAYIGWVHHG